MLIGDENGFKPCTPHGCMVLMEKSGIDPSGKVTVNASGESEITLSSSS